MAHSPQTTEEQIIALTTSLNEILKVQDLTSASHNNQQSSSTILTSSVIGSTDLSLLQFTLNVQQPTSQNNKVEQKEQQQMLKYNNKAHVILHVDGVSASASPSFSCGDASSLEVVQLSLISDKFPVDSIPSNAFPKDAMFLVKFWADLTYEQGHPNAHDLFHVTTIFESSKVMQISCKTSVCSFGRSIGDKMEQLSGVHIAPNRVLYQSVQAPLCDYLVNFIRKLKECGDVTTMNGVLENFSVLQVISDDATQQILLCLAYVFEVCPPELSATTGAMCKVYKLDGPSTTSANSSSS